MPTQQLHLSPIDAERYYFDAWCDLRRALQDTSAGWAERRGASERVETAYRLWHAALCRAYRASGERIRVSAVVHEDLGRYIAGKLNSAYSEGK